MQLELPVRCARVVTMKTGRLTSMVEGYLSWRGAPPYQKKSRKALWQVAPHPWALLVWKSCQMSSLMEKNFANFFLVLFGVPEERGSEGWSPRP